MTRETDTPVHPEPRRHPRLRVHEVLLFSSALLGLALCVNFGASVLPHALPPYVISIAQAVMLVMLAAPLVAWIMYRAGISVVGPYTASEASESPHRMVLLAFVCILLMLVAALLVGWYAQREASTRAASAAWLVNTAGRQRMLSQAIAREATAPAARRNRDRLSVAIAQMNAEATSARNAIDTTTTQYPELLR